MNWKKLLSTRRIRQLAQGRPPGPNPRETRGEFHRDYGRAVFSTPVRRLQDKAQVFPLEPIDAVRTRLTHSLEVSSMARGLANGACQELVSKRIVSRDNAYDIETIAATCGLLHDIGNPPFGHFGERAIRDWFALKEAEDPNIWRFDLNIGKSLRADLLNFEGNAQTLRLLSKLQVLSDRHGLNLTAGTFSALCKYTAHSLEVRPQPRQSKKKLGYFSSEREVVAMVREETGTGDARNPISLLVEASDDMVYSIIDIEDGIKKNVITWDEAVKYLRREGGKIAADLCDQAKRAMSKSPLWKRMNTGARQEGTAQYFRTFLMRDASKYVQLAFSSRYRQIMDGSYDGELLYDSAAGPIYKALKALGATRVYNAKEVLRLEILGYRVIHSLLDTFWRADSTAKTKSFEGKAYALMSQNYRIMFESPDRKEKALPERYRKAMLVTDYICGMTDTFAVNLHRELTNG